MSEAMNKGTEKTEFDPDFQALEKVGSVACWLHGVALFWAWLCLPWHLSCVAGCDGFAPPPSPHYMPSSISVLHSGQGMPPPEAANCWRRPRDSRVCCTPPSQHSLLSWLCSGALLPPCRTSHECLDGQH